MNTTARAEHGPARIAVCCPTTLARRNGGSTIVPANLRAMEALYYGAMLEEARVFQVADRLVALFSQGVLPVGAGPAGDFLYRSWKNDRARLNASQRQAAYRLAFGIGATNGNASVNRDFQDLWLRFISTLGMYSAEIQALPPSARSVSPDEVRRTGQELAANLSAHAPGIPLFAGREMRADIESLMELLSDPEITRAFGVQGPWELVEKLAVSESRAKPNIPRSRKRAEAGRIIIRWLSNHGKLLATPAAPRFLKEKQIRERRVAASFEKLTTHPTDFDLLHACESWLAVTGTEDAVLDR